MPSKGEGVQLPAQNQPFCLADCALCDHLQKKKSKRVCVVWVGLGLMRDVQGIRWHLITHFGDKCILEILTDCSVYRCGGVQMEKRETERGEQI